MYISGPYSHTFTSVLYISGVYSIQLYISGIYSIQLYISGIYSIQLYISGIFSIQLYIQSFYLHLRSIQLVSYTFGIFIFISGLLQLHLILVLSLTFTVHIRGVINKFAEKIRGTCNQPSNLFLKLTLSYRIIFKLIHLHENTPYITTTIYLTSTWSKMYPVQIQ